MKDVGDVEGRERHVNLSKGGTRCEGLPRKVSMSKCVILKNDASEGIGRGICHNVDIDLVIDSENRPLGDDRMAILIAETLSEEYVPSDWMFQLRGWHISSVYLNGASLYDHNQVHLQNVANAAMRQRSRVGALVYYTMKEKKNMNKIPKIEALLSNESITLVLTKLCCSLNCLQPFRRDKIAALRFDMYVNGGVFYWKHRLLDVHKQIHQDSNGNEMVTLEGREVCPKAWTTIMGVHRSSYYRYKTDALIDKCAEQHGNLDTKKPRTHTLQATAVLQTILDNTADHMPHKSRTREDSEKVVAMSLPSSFHWISTLPEINATNCKLGLKNVSGSGLSRICRDLFLEFSVKKRGDKFARCGNCDDLKQLWAACTRGSGAYNVCQKRLDMHIASQHIESYAMQIATYRRKNPRNV